MRLALHRHGTSAQSDAEASEGARVVLLVEDEQAQRWLFGSALRREGYRVIEADNGEQALKVCGKAGPLDLVITDIRMPMMSGIELAMRLRERFPAVPVLFVTGYDVVGVVGLDEFPAQVLQKPFTRQMLLDRVRQILREPDA